MSSLPHFLAVLILIFVCPNSKDILKYRRLKKLVLILIGDIFYIVLIDCLD